MPRRISAFSLVELSIVLVVIGLLVGGVTAGQSLVRGAQLRSVITEYMRYMAATQGFKDKYGALPGDFDDATSQWGTSTACGGTAVNGACNGNADGNITSDTAANTVGEPFQFWRQLSLAGYIEGTYTGISSSGGANGSVIGSNVPASRFPAGGWSIVFDGVTSGIYDYYQDYGNLIFFGGISGSDMTWGNILTPEQAWSIDNKMDDSMPGTGKITANDLAGFGTATSCTTSATNTDYAGKYNLTNKIAICSLAFVRVF